MPLFTNVLKDVNFAEINHLYQRQQINVLNLDFLQQMEIIDILNKDSQFLSKHKIMDYSLYLAIEKAPRKSEGWSKDYGRNVYFSKDGLEAYHIGVIDYL